MPALNELAAPGNGCYLIMGATQSALSVSSCRGLDQAQIATAARRHSQQKVLIGLTDWASPADQPIMVVIVIILRLAAGHLDLLMEHQLATHDFMALIPVLKGAGAIVTDWSGSRWFIF